MQRICLQYLYKTSRYNTPRPSDLKYDWCFNFNSNIIFTHVNEHDWKQKDYTCHVQYEASRTLRKEKSRSNKKKATMEEK